MHLLPEMRGLRRDVPAFQASQSDGTRVFLRMRYWRIRYEPRETADVEESKTFLIVSIRRPSIDDAVTHWSPTIWIATSNDLFEGGLR